MAQSLQKESSLTAPEDRDLSHKWMPDQASPALTLTEGNEAVKVLKNTDFTDKFPKIDRTYADPAIQLQTYGLISFVPAKGASPNKRGIYGFAKLRGNYGTLEECSQQSEYLIRYVDSYHHIFHAYVGRPFPLTESSSFSAETEEVDIRKETTESISKSIKEKKQEDEREIRDIKNREKQLLEDSKKAINDELSDDPYEVYITTRVKKAQLIWTYLQHKEKIEEIQSLIVKTKKELSDLDGEYPEFNDTYYERYMNARQESGLDTDKNETENSFIKYLVEDVNIPEVDEEYRKTYEV
jgi:hypothetical protein